MTLFYDLKKVGKSLLLKSLFWVALCAIGIGQLSAQNVLFVKSGVTDGDNITVGTETGAAYTTLKEAVAHSIAGDIVKLTEDVAELGTVSDPYGLTCVILNGITIDGCGYKLRVTPESSGSYRSAIYIKSGTIRNLDVSGGGRTLFSGGVNGDIVIDNCIVNATGGASYPFNTDAANINYSVTITNSTLYGWCSYTGDFKSVNISNTTFAQGNSDYARFRPYSPTLLENVTFDNSGTYNSPYGYAVDANQDRIIFNNCNVGGTTITTANITSLLGSTSDDLAVIAEGTYSADAEGRITGGVYGGNLDQLNAVLAEGYGAVALGTTPETYRVTPVYYIHYNNNGGTGTMADDYVAQDAPDYTVPASTFTNGDWTFDKWNTKADGTGTDLNVGDVMTLTSDTTLYAQWKGVAKIGDVHYTTLNAAAAAVPVGTPTTITILQNLNFYDIASSNLANKTITFTGTRADTLTVTDLSHIKPSAGYGSDLTFENITLKHDPTADNYQAIINVSKITCNDCEILGYTTGYAETVICNNCTFTQTTGKYHLWTYGSNCTFNSCTFNTSYNNGKAVNVYKEGDLTQPYRVVTFNDCSFNAPTNPGSNRSAIQINSSNCCYVVNVNNCEVNGYHNEESTAVDGYKDLINNKSTSVATTLYVDGTQIIKQSDCDPVAMIGDTYYNTLQSAADAAHEMTGDVTIELLNNATGYSIVHQKAGLNLTIEGNEHFLAGQIIVDGNARAAGTETLTIQNVKFQDDKSHFCSGTDAFVVIPSTKTTGAPYYTGAYNYAHNITVDHCSFNSTSSNLDVVGIKATSGATCYNLKVITVTGDNLHSLAQLTATEGALIDHCTATNTGSFVNVSGGGAVDTISNCTFTGVDPSDGYAVRENGGSGVEIYLINNTFEANSVLQLGKNSGSDASGHINVISGNYTGDLNNAQSASGTARFVLKGGTYSEPKATVDNWCAPGYMAVANDPDAEHCTVYPSYVAVYDANGGTGTMVNDTVLANHPDITVKECGFTREGYAFVRWNSKADGTGTAVAPSTSMTLTSDTVLYAQWGRVLNATNGNIYDDLQAAISAATAGDSLVVLTDLHQTATIAINKSLSINGNKHVITSTKDRGMWFDAGNVTLNLKNFYFDGTGMDETQITTRGIRAIQVDQDNVTLNMDSCRIYNVKEYPFYVFRDVDNANVTIKNSYIKGLSSMRSYASNSTFNFMNDTLYSTNPCTNNMDYANIYLDGNYEATLSKDNTISIEKCVIISEVEGSCHPEWLGIAFDASGNNVTIDANTKIIDGNEQDMTSNLNIWLGGGKNYVTMPLTNTQIEAMDNNNYTVTASGSNSVVSAPVLWEGTNVTTLQNGFNKMYIDFHAPFLLGLLETDDVLTLDDDITLKDTVFPGGVKFTLNLATYNITTGDNCILLSEADTVITDEEVNIFCAEEGMVNHIDNGDGTYTYYIAHVLNANTGNLYDDLQSAIDAATAGDSIVVLTDLSSSVFININKSIIINGGKHTLTSTATRGFRITQSNLNVTIRNLNEVCPLNPVDGDYRGISFDLDLSNVNLLVDSCRITGSDYAINLTPRNTGHTVTVKNSYIQGWAALNSFAQNTAFTLVNDTLHGINKGNCSSNTSMYYATICLDGGSLLGVTGSSNTTLDVQNSVIIAQENTDCVQRWADVKFGASICDVSVDGNTKIIDGNGNDVTSKVYINGAKNTVTLPLTSEEKAVLAAQYYTLTDNPDGSTKVSHSIRYTRVSATDPIYVDFHYPFTTHNLAAGDLIELLEDVTLTQEVYAPFDGNFTIHFTDGSDVHSITQGDYSIVLDDDQTCTTDKQVAGLFTAFSGSDIIETDNGDNTYTYSVAPYYTIVYYSNNSADEDDSQVRPYGETVYLKDYTTFDHADSTIYRWNTQADGNGTDYALGAAYSEDSDIELYAVWRLNLGMTSSATDVVCFGQNNGTDTVKIIGGEAPYQIVLSGGALTDNVEVTTTETQYIFTGLKPSTNEYKVWVTDVLTKDTIRASFTISQPDTLVISSLTVPVTPCPLMGSGTYPVSMTTTGGNGGNVITWGGDVNDVDDLSSTITPDADDRDRTYTVTVTVTDSKNCSATETTTFSVAPVIANDGTAHSNTTMTIAAINKVILDGCDTVIRDFGTPAFAFTNAAITEGILDTIYNNVSTVAPDSVFAAGTTTVITWTAVDTCGHEVTATQEITIEFAPCPSVEDFDHNVYPSVRIGCDCWTTKNLSSTHYSDGREIENVMHYPVNTRATVGGNLYDWYATMDTAANGLTDIEAACASPNGTIQGICPEGWHVPTQAEVDALMGSVNTEDLMSVGVWIPDVGTNASGFDMYPAGLYNSERDRYERMYVSAYFWILTPPSAVYHACEFGAACSTTELIPGSLTMGFSVRCVLDKSDE